MGDCVLSQGIEMEQVIVARDRFLKPNGKNNHIANQFIH